MKRVLLSTLLTVLLLSGCGGSENTPPAPTAESTEPPKTSTLDVKPQKPDTQEPAAPTDTDLLPTAYMPYASVLDRYAITLGGDSRYEETLSPFLHGAKPADVGYRLMDLDGDDTPELVLASTDPLRKDLIEIYTLLGDRPLRLFSANPEDQYTLFRFGDGSGYGLANNTWNVIDEFENAYNYYYSLSQWRMEQFDAITCVEDQWHRQDSPFSMEPISEDEAFGLLADYESVYAKVEVTPFSEYTESGHADRWETIPDEIARRLIFADGRDLLAIWTDPPEIVQNYAEPPMAIDGNPASRVVVMALYDGVEIELWSGEPILENGEVDGWNTTGTLLERTLNAGETVSMELHVPEGIPDRCIIASRESDEGVFSALWPAQYDGMFGGEQPYLLFSPEW